MHINNGSVLVNGYITWRWANVMFWRTFFAISAHYLAVYITLSLCLKKGFLTESYDEKTFEEVYNRPSDDTTTMFSFVRQMFYHKTLAYTNHEKKIKQKKRKCC